MERDGEGEGGRGDLLERAPPLPPLVFSLSSESARRHERVLVTFFSLFSRRERVVYRSTA